MGNLKTIMCRLKLRQELYSSELGTFRRLRALAQVNTGISWLEESRRFFVIRRFARARAMFPKRAKVYDVQKAARVENPTIKNNNIDKKQR